MAAKDLAEKLGPGERALLLALEEQDGATPTALVEAGAFQEEVQVMNAASWLRSKRLLRIRERLVRLYSLRDPDWVSRQLPERRALEVLLETYDLPLPEMASRAGLSEEEMSVTLGWLRRKGWADIERGDDAPHLRLREEGRIAASMRGPDELLIKRLGEGELQEGEADPRVLAQLLQRQEIVRERRQVLRTLHLTQEGRRILAQGLEPVEEVAQITPELLQGEAWRSKRYRKYDVKAYAPAAYAGKRHPLSTYAQKIRRIFLQMGFTEIEGGYVGPAFWSFDALFQPQDHPARDMLDTFYLKDDLTFDLPPKAVLQRVGETHEHGGGTGSTGWGYRWSEAEARRAIMRPHTTANTIQYLAEHPDPPQKAFIIGKNFRREATDATHLTEFHQIEGVVMEEGANLAMLMGTIEAFYRKMGLSVRFRPGYFPYTEPSLEPEVRLPDQWLELGGSGIFRPEVTAPLGIDAPVLAWGLGLERLVMALEGLEDMRTLIWNDLDWLRDSRSVV
ncbi:MAG: phenylalanine--tRNA ligase subunit alpha [Thermoplasmata archaeon]|nr:phenylalanine--tRNA ligase subunit alpha [Thermoplasmata archaeon]